MDLFNYRIVCYQDDADRPPPRVSSLFELCEYALVSNRRQAIGKITRNISTRDQIGLDSFVSLEVTTSDGEQRAVGV